jgi:hypothetical protein
MPNTTQTASTSTCTQEDFAALNSHFVSINSRVKQVVLERVMNAINTGTCNNPNTLRKQVGVITSRFACDNKPKLLSCMNRLLNKALA